jgi:hypothetical protein
MMNKKSQSSTLRSPVPKRSLPQAGESLTYQYHDTFDNFLKWEITAAIICFVAATEWIMRWLNLAISPWVWTLVALAFGAFATYRWWRIKDQLSNYRLGVRGERIVGQMLEDCRKSESGFAVFHDIPGNGFNVDHVLIGPRGIFAIETKTFSKPFGNAQVDYDGKQIFVGGFVPDRDPIAQAEMGARFIRERLMNMTGREVNVRPVVLFPGWYVNRSSQSCRVWVLNPKELGGFLKQEPSVLSKEDIALFKDRLELHLSSIS